MSFAKINAACIVFVTAIYTVMNVYAGGEPSPLTAALTVVGLVQYVVLERKDNLP